MNLFDRVFAEPEFLKSPPVLVDVGAAGGVHPAWRRLARHAIGLGFEPDSREAGALTGTPAGFKRWIYHPGLVVPAAVPGGRAELHLTRSPQCSSTRRPRSAALDAWAFAEFFTVEQTRLYPATTLMEAVTSAGLSGVDWLKCDTQGIDLGIFKSLPASWRSRVLVVEFEPGIIDAYEGEEKLADVLAEMSREPFWLADLCVGRTPRGRPEMFRRHLGAAALAWVRRLGPDAPAWANTRYLRDFAQQPETLDRRAHLLGWVFATLAGQPASALDIAERGARLFGGGLFAALATASLRSLRWAMVRGFPGWLWRRMRRI